MYNLHVCVCVCIEYSAYVILTLFYFILTFKKYLMTH